MAPSWHEPPSDARVRLAMGVAPMLLVVAFALVGLDLIEFELAVVVALACAVWVVYELHHCQREIDEHHLRATTQGHGVWRSPDAGDAMAREAQIDSRFG